MSRKRMERRFKLKVVLWALCLSVTLSAGLVLHSLAQSNENPWTPPVNISRSGAASQPVVAAAPDGTLHALWWDAVDGEQYARTTNITGTAWTAPVSLAQIVGKRLVDKETNKVTLTVPRQVRMLSDGRGNVHAFWYDVTDQLLDAQTLGGVWSGGTVLADAALNMDVAADAGGALHLAYVRSSDNAGSPAGVYYRTTGGGTGWSAPALVYASSYFRTATPEEAYVSVAGDSQGQALVAWDDLLTGNSFYARSTDGGRTWSAPQAASSSQTEPAVHARVASTPNKEFLMLWQDTAAGSSCRLTQRRSTDGGQTWSAPERVLTSLDQCPGRWSLATAGDGRLWLVGTSLLNSPNALSGSGILAAWDGKVWSEPVNVSLRFQDKATGRFLSLNCLGLTVAGTSAGTVGCDSSGDVWAARNAVELAGLMPALKPAWDAPQMLSDPKNPGVVKGAPALAADDQGKLYALWSESPAESEPGAALYSAAWDGNNWSQAIQVLRSASGATGSNADAPLITKAEQPSLAADSQGRLHAVWSGGTSGEILYSWTYARDAASTQGWAEPAVLPAPTQVGSWPDILADPRGNVLHVIYAVPYNEGRGIYYMRSNDGGATWSEPMVIFDAAAAKWESADKPRLALDAKTNVLHATWLRAALPDSTGAQAVMYARSTDGGQTWSAPVQAAEGSVDWPRVAVAGAGQVYLIWNQVRTQAGSPSAEVWGQYSLDGGQRWSELARVRGFEQVSGPVSLASEGAGKLDLVGVGQGAGGESTLFYTQWNGQSWTESETFGLGQNVMWGNAVAAALAGTGRLGVALRESVQALDGTGQFQVVATGRQVTAAPAAEPAPTFTPLPTLTAEPTATPFPTATSKPQLKIVGTLQPVASGPFQAPLAIGGALATVIVLGVVVGRIVWTTRR